LPTGAKVLFANDRRGIGQRPVIGRDPHRLRVAGQRRDAECHAKAKVKAKPIAARLSR
jgi:hypothetical protein